MAFCSNCGHQLANDAKFCFECGAAVCESVVSRIENEKINNSNESQQRKQEYVGTVLKCSNCGAVITQTTVVCPDCGYKIVGREAVMSVKLFKEQLEVIESTRSDDSKKAVMREFMGLVDPVDKKILMFVQNFPIPNTVDDILEFVLLAINNIDVGLSKNTALNKYYKAASSIESNFSIKRSISNAWVSKMQQAYQKAEILFPNDPVFLGIQKVYYEKMKELKIKVSKNS